MGVSLEEVLRRCRFTEQQFEPATPEEALNFLLDETERVESGVITQMVLANNLLQGGKEGPSIYGEDIRNIPTPLGERSVSGETWVKAIDLYLKTLGLSANFLFEDTRREGNISEVRRMAFPNRQILLERIRRYDPESGQLTSLSVKISHRTLSE